MPRAGFTGAMTVQRVFSVKQTDGVNPLQHKHFAHGNSGLSSSSESDDSSVDSVHRSKEKKQIAPMVDAPEPHRPEPPSASAEAPRNAWLPPPPQMAQRDEASSFMGCDVKPFFCQSESSAVVENLVRTARSYISQLDEIISQLASEFEMASVPNEVLPNHSGVCGDIGKLKEKAKSTGLESESTDDKSFEAKVVTKQSAECTEETTNHFLDALLRFGGGSGGPGRTPLVWTLSLGSELLLESQLCPPPSSSWLPLFLCGCCCESEDSLY